uniref:Ras-GEF domain-containing protein n=1 Tax=Mustela putorius furo TaxID=9669 RepID=M3XQ42_MUSPF
APEASCHPMNQLKEEMPDLLDFPPKLVAEQLTYMDSKLFKKVLCHQCLGSIWSRKNKPGNEHLAPTVWTTISQFNGAVSCVITTSLVNPSMTAQDKAMVVEHWISLAKACQILGIYSSLHAILSALQSISFHLLRRTWKNGQPDIKDSESKWMEGILLSRNVSLALQEPSNKFATLVRHLQKAWKRCQRRTQGVVPYLGTFLTDLDYMEVGEPEHCGGGTRVLRDTMLLQVTPENYTLEPQHPLRAWFPSVEWLSDDESWGTCVFLRLKTVLWKAAVPPGPSLLVRSMV